MKGWQVQIFTCRDNDSSFMSKGICAWGRWTSFLKIIAWDKWPFGSRLIQIAFQRSFLTRIERVSLRWFNWLIRIIKGIVEQRLIFRNHGLLSEEKYIITIFFYLKVKTLKLFYAHWVSQLLKTASCLSDSDFEKLLKATSQILMLDSQAF